MFGGEDERDREGREEKGKRGERPRNQWTPRTWSVAQPPRLGSRELRVWLGLTPLSPSQSLEKEPRGLLRAGSRRSVSPPPESWP